MINKFLFFPICTARKVNNSDKLVAEDLCIIFVKCLGVHVQKYMIGGVALSICVHMKLLEVVSFLLTHFISPMSRVKSTLRDGNNLMKVDFDDLCS